MNELVKEGLLRPVVDAASPEWLVPSATDREPNPPAGYVVSFIKFHRYGLGSPLSHFMRALMHRYDCELHHFTPNSINHAAIFVALCEGYLGIDPHWELFLYLYKAEFQIRVEKSGSVTRKWYLHCGSVSVQPRRPDEFPPVKVSTNNSGWDSEWFYLRNDNVLTQNRYDPVPKHTSKLKRIVSVSRPRGSLTGNEFMHARAPCSDG